MDRKDYVELVREIRRVLNRAARGEISNPAALAEIDELTVIKPCCSICGSQLTSTLECFSCHPDPYQS